MSGRILCVAIAAAFLSGCGSKTPTDADLVDVVGAYPKSRIDTCFPTDGVRLDVFECTDTEFADWLIQAPLAREQFGLEFAEETEFRKGLERHLTTEPTRPLLGGSLDDADGTIHVELRARYGNSGSVIVELESQHL